MAALKQKVFKVRIITQQGNETLFVRAKSAARAAAHVTLKHLEVTLATVDDAVAYGVAGGAIQEAAE